MLQTKNVDERREFEEYINELRKQKDNAEKHAADLSQETKRYVLLSREQEHQISQM